MSDDAGGLKWPCILLLGLIAMAMLERVTEKLITCYVDAAAMQVGYVQQVDKDSGKVLWVKDQSPEQ